MNLLTLFVRHETKQKHNLFWKFMLLGYALSHCTQTRNTNSLPNHDVHVR